MKNTVLTIAIASLCGLPTIATAQGTYLSDPSDTDKLALVVAPGGNIGAGTTNAKGRVHIVGEATGPALLLDSTSSRGAYVSFQKDGADLGGMGLTGVWHANTSSDVGIWTQAGRRLAFFTNGDNYERLTIAANGKVGINTYNPSNQLDVVSPGLSTLIGIANRLDAGDIGMDQGYLRIRTLNAEPIVFYPGDAGEKMRIEESGNVGIGRVPEAKLDVAGDISCTVLKLLSDRAQKSGFGLVNNLEVLNRVVALPLSTWHYTNEVGVTHIGPMAQDFKAAFNVGSDDKHIATVDADGVLFAAVQGINQKFEAALREKDVRIAALEREVTTLRQDLLARVAALEKRAGEPDLQRVDATVIPSASLATVSQPR
jgi:hypothetical protein